MAIIKQCCCCSVRRGSIVTGIYGILYSIIIIAHTSLMFKADSIWDLQGKIQPHFAVKQFYKLGDIISEIEDSHRTEYYGRIFALVFFGLFLLSSILLVFASCKRYRFLLLPFLIVLCSLVVLHFITVVELFGAMLQMSIMGISLVLPLAFHITSTLIDLSCVLCVVSLFQQIQQRQRQREQGSRRLT
ncbi:uncharacterized protein [Diadema setosum]|uniref:uncharacterized protein n=1 Tax=Diadema setosum TaxID=31175 RepID=UPI003B3AE197